MTAYINRIDAHGLTLWLPPLPSQAAATVVRHDIAEILAPATDADEVLQLLDMHGFSLRLKVNYHGPQTYHEWSLAARDETWAARRLAEARA